MQEKLLQLTGIVKHFDSVQALRGVDFELAGSEIVSLIGTNGAGKSTLCNVIAGIHMADKGEMKINGKPVVIKNSSMAEENGISIVHQEPILVPNMTVAQNMFLGAERTRGRLILDREKMTQTCHELIHSLGFVLDVNRLASQLTLVEKEVVSISRALLKEPKILILDEVTAPLNAFEVKHLFSIIREIRTKGCGIIFISHKIDETLDIADRVVVFRDGEKVMDQPVVESTSEQEIISAMLGDTVEGDIQNVIENYAEIENREVLLDVKDLSLERFFSHMDFRVHRGEILGFAGLKGAGITELLYCIQGILCHDGGELVFNGKSIRCKKPAEGLRHGIGMVTHDKHRDGLAAVLDVKDNITIGNLKEYTRALGVLDGKRLVGGARQEAKRVGVKAKSMFSPITTLSGGNQQKVVIAKVLLLGLDLLLVDEPTHGVDVKAKSDIYKILVAQKEEGRSVIAYSPETRELLNICDRILIVANGSIIGEVKRETPEFTEAYILNMMHSARSRKIDATDAV